MSKEAIAAIRKEYRNPPELRAGRILLYMGLTQDEVLELDVPDGIKLTVYNAMRDFDRTGKYRSTNNNNMWIYD